MIAGITVGDDDYPNVETTIKFVIQVFRNSVGDINAPEYDYWSNKVAVKETESIAYGMIGWGWFLWFSNIFFMLIILLNFLIAIISQSYDSVMTREMIF